jgi:IS30 family transposase
MSMKTDRELMRLAREGLSREQIEKALNTLPATIDKAAKRLGINLGRYVRKPNGRPKLKNKT